MTKEKTKEEIFLDVLVETQGDLDEAKKKSKLMRPPQTLIDKGVGLIVASARNDMSLLTPAAVKIYKKLLTDPAQPGAKQLESVASGILDRGGVPKVDKSEIDHKTPPNSVLVLPVKAPLDPELTDD